jgi:hypothetical protein
MATWHPGFVHAGIVVLHTLYISQSRGEQIFQKSRSHLKILSCQKDDTNQVPCWRPTKIWQHHTKFSCHGDLAPGICAFLSQSTFLHCTVIPCCNFFWSKDSHLSFVFNHHKSPALLYMTENVSQPQKISDKILYTHESFMFLKAIAFITDEFC